VLRILDKLKAQKQKNRQRQLELPQGDRQTAAELSTAFDKMFAIQNKINADELKQRILEQLIADEQNVSLAFNVATDGAYAKQLFGPKGQAQARVYAIDMLLRAGDKGDRELVLRAIQTLGQRLEKGTHENIKGIHRDYEELITGYIDSGKVETILEDPQTFFSDIMISPKSKLDVLRAIYFSKIQRDVPEHVQKAKLGPFLKAVVSPKT
jgi:hypothetical protein